VTVAGWTQLAVFVAILTAITPPLGAYLVRVFAGERVLLSRPLGPVERGTLRLFGVDGESQDWKAYARNALIFSAVCLVGAYAVLRTQAIHPWDHGIQASLPWDVAFNTAASFVSNTSWQFYAGETSLTTFSQMASIALHSWLSAAVGLATGIAVIRGFARNSGAGLGNFWVDLVRGLLYVLLPLGTLGALLMIADGVVQSFGPGVIGTQAAIKTLGSVGGGYYNVNSAMPFENAGWLSNLVQMLLIVVVPAGLTAAFGRAVGSRRQGWSLYAVMLVLLVGGFAIVYAGESGPTPAMQATGLTGVNMEGKEQRFGDAGTALYAVVTTSGASGAVNGAMESLSGTSALAPLSLMMTGELAFGGIGSGLSSMLLVVLLTVFLAGLLVGRTPEYIGRKLDVRTVKLVMIGTLAAPMLALGLTGLATASDYGRVSIFDSGPQGFSEILYAYTSQTMNNGSAFAGYTGFVQPADAAQFGISFANVMGGLAMLAGRYVPMLAALAVAGAFATRPVMATGRGTLRTDNPTFVSLVLAVVVIVVLLTFVPALLLGPGVQGLSDRLF
jgi:potassium-transporting ATPase potassium-binding subunit